mmetsp:Transcript_54245/g.94600  ORF Transcript_54245/g.94600 Transcript_54245/m.94600 type:complete len:304 (-) Transcript_54245:1130-2041(-)|eukprot:CAMPEP_0185006010 /NCGR_PEP_ID=MMETSP1098-20130426/83406_1 /TAXON_ID=89044 /ORGANISM="Spumella elongata, Strain CCAP 955/1" /LENGTH=303 /DNA_ID=CAMNT_0027534103 /DNA_START=46 /DNA_END=957 /DNA_ORIENTATION=-
MNAAVDPKALEQAEKKRKRLERNRESARECRKRKKEKRTALRQQLAMLEADNLQLRLKLQVGHDTSNIEEKSKYISTKLETMVKEGANEVEIQKAIAEYQERYSDYGRDRRSAIDFHVAQLRRCLQPTQTTRAILWLMSLSRQFTKPDFSGEIDFSKPNELFNLWLDLLKECKPTAHQKKLMVSYTNSTVSGSDPFADINNVSQTCNGMLDRLVEIICSKNSSLDAEMNNIQTILSPRQIAKFILWIDQNPACMQMLEALWPHLTYTQPVRNNSTSDNLSSVGEQENDNENESDDDDESSDND